MIAADNVGSLGNRATRKEGGSNLEKRSHPRGTTVHLPGKLESADVGGATARRNPIRIGLSPIRPCDRRGQRRTDRAPDRANTGINNASIDNSRILGSRY